MMRRRNHTRKGFNLIEAAIVLGVVGFVIGGIWYAAAAVSFNMKIRETLDGVNLIAFNLQRLISRADAAAIGYGNITGVVVAANAAPETWGRQVDGTHPWVWMQYPFGKDLEIRSGPTGFGIVLAGLPQSACVALVPKLSASGNGISYVNFYPSGASRTIPISQATATAACAQTGTTVDVLAVYEQLTRNN